MAEEYRVFYQCKSDLKKKYSGLSDEILEQIFVEGFRSGKKYGFDAGYITAISDDESFNFDDSQDDCSLDDDLGDDTYVRFDDLDEVLNF